MSHFGHVDVDFSNSEIIKRRFKNKFFFDRLISLLPVGVPLMMDKQLKLQVTWPVLLSRMGSDKDVTDWVPFMFGPPAMVVFMVTIAIVMGTPPACTLFP